MQCLTVALTDHPIALALRQRRLALSVLAAVLASTLLNVAPVRAAPAVQVVLLQAPAWLERGSERQALRRGAVLTAQDRIITGTASRVILRLAEGSVVKLGANADLALDELVPAPAAGSIFKAALNVLKGAFRFTTTVAGGKREVSARLRSATIGIRGTDVWGKAEDERDFVVLLEGQVSIERDGTETMLDTPLSLFMAPRGAPALPVAPVDENDLARWAQETEPQAGNGIIRDDGEYRLNLASYPSAAAAHAAVALLDVAGVAAETEAVNVAGRDWWRVVLTGYATREDALHAAGSVAASIAATGPWVERRR